MAIIILDKRNMSLKINMKAEESFAPDQEVASLAQRAKELNQKRLNLEAELTKLLEDCHAWNRNHDEEYDSNFKNQVATEKEKSKSSSNVVEPNKPN